MKNVVLAALVAVAALATNACAPPRVLVGHSYASSDKSIETIIEKSGVSVKTGDGQKQNLFNVYMRVCNQDANNATTQCKDTMILDNVTPSSI